MYKSIVKKIIYQDNEIISITICKDFGEIKLIRRFDEDTDYSDCDFDWEELKEIITSHPDYENTN